MAKRGKKYRKAAEAIEKLKPYPLSEALDIVKKNAFANFDESVELAVRLNVDPRHADQMVRGTVVLPHGTGKTLRVLVFAKGDAEKEAKEAGADFVGAEDMVEKIQGGWLDFDLAIATPDMMGQVGRLGKILGPRGLMPNPKVGTVTKDVAKAVKEVVSVPVIAVGNIRYPKTVEKILAEGDADFVAMGRALIADPLWPEKAREGKTREIRYCISCNEGCLGNRLTDYIGCSINPEAGRENRLSKKQKAKIPRHVTVVGAGPAGITAALQADKMGHEVVLYERDACIGGQLRYFASMPTKGRIEDLLGFYEFKLANSNIKVLLKTEFDPKKAALPLDVVVVATGSVPVIPILPGIKDERIMTPVDCLNGRRPKGDEDILVVGGGVTGCELALFLKSLGNRIILVEKEDKLAADLEEISRMDLMKRLSREKIQVFLNMSLREVGEKGAIIADHEGKKFAINPSRIVLAMGNHSQAILRRRLKGNTGRLFVIGDAKEPRTIYYAVHEAYKAIMSIS